MTITMDVYFLIGLAVGGILCAPVNFLIALWLHDWPGRYVQVGRDGYVKPGKFYTIRRIAKAYAFWWKYDVCWWR